MSKGKVENKTYTMPNFTTVQAAEPSSIYTSVSKQQEKHFTNTVDRIEELKKMMNKAAKEFDFITAAALRDEILRLEAMGTN